MSTPAKRQRGPILFNSAKRAINKEIISVAKTVSNAQLQTILQTFTYPATAVGIRWNLQFIGAATGSNHGKWAIIVVREAMTADSLGGADAATTYRPESQVIAIGDWAVQDTDVGGGPTIFHAEGTTKAMRKFQGGDELMFIVNGINAINVTLRGTVQFFLKT